MKYKTAFRLAIQFMGVYFIASCAAQLMPGAIVWGYESVMGGGLGASVPGVPWELRQMLYLAAEGAVGIVLYFHPNFIVNRVIPSNRPYCHECGYELTGLAERGVCPECGTAFERSGPPQPS